MDTTDTTIATRDRSIFALPGNIWFVILVVGILFSPFFVGIFSSDTSEGDGPLTPYREAAKKSIEELERDDTSPDYKKWTALKLYREAQKARDNNDDERARMYTQFRLSLESLTSFLEGRDNLTVGYSQLKEAMSTKTVYFIWRSNSAFDTYLPDVVEPFADHIDVVQHVFPENTPSTEIAEWYKNNETILHGNYIISDKTCAPPKRFDSISHVVNTTLDYLIQKSFEGYYAFDESYTPGVRFSTDQFRLFDYFLGLYENMDPTCAVFVHSEFATHKPDGMSEGEFIQQIEQTLYNFYGITKDSIIWIPTAIDAFGQKQDQRDYVHDPGAIVFVDRHAVASTVSDHFKPDLTPENGVVILPESNMLWQLVQSGIITEENLHLDEYILLLLFDRYCDRPEQNKELYYFVWYMMQSYLQ